jgi:hypothetical protein
MEKIGDVVNRVLKKDRAPEPCGEKDYLALWDEIIPKEIRRHARLVVRDDKMIVLVDNPTAKHQVFLRREKIIAEFQKNRLAVKELEIKQARPAGPANQVRRPNVSRFNRSAGHSV